HELQLALERVGGLREVVARLLEIGDRLERRPARRIEIAQDGLVARHRGVDVADAFGQELRLAQGYPRPVGLVDRDPAEAPQELHRSGLILAPSGVVDQLLERLAVVPVLEDLEPLLARRLFVAQAARVERRGLRADGDPLRSIRDPIAALREEGDELVPLLTR